MSMFEWGFPLIGVLVTAIGALILGRRNRQIGKAEERADAIQQDVENAKRIEKLADAARVDTDDRSAVDRLRDKHPGNLRD